MCDEKRNRRNKISVGIACFRFNKNKPEVLLVCKRFTYAFNAFVHGNYRDDDESLRALFNGMTVDEKLDILSFNFSQMWYRIWLGQKTDRTRLYIKAKRRFEDVFMYDDAARARLRQLINQSTNSRRIWEIPKGRKKSNAEYNVHCAIRELREETGLTKNQYKLFLATRKYTYMDGDVTYTNIYYPALINYNISPRISFNNKEQTDEIVDIRWMSIEDIRREDPTGRLENIIKPLFSYIKKYGR